MTEVCNVNQHDDRDHSAWRTRIFAGIGSVLHPQFASSAVASGGVKSDDSILIYPFSIYYSRLCVEYVATLQLTESDGAVLTRDTFESSISKWSQGSDTLMRAIARQAELSDVVLNVLRLCTRLDKSFRRSGTINWAPAISCGIKFDIDDMERKLLNLTRQSNFLQEIQDLSEQALDDFMDVMQSFIDRQGTSARRLERILRRVVQETGHIPRFLFVAGVLKNEPNPRKGGGFADVWVGEISGCQIALKVLRTFENNKSHREKMHQDFCSEAMVWRQLNHPNILPLLGVCEDVFYPRLAMVSPWMENGDMVSFLRTNPNEDRPALMVGIARGLCYLHQLEPAILHGDLRGANVLVDKDMTPRISDFGLFRIVDSQSTMLPTSSFLGGGSLRWQAPELIGAAERIGVPCVLSESTDVYAFACVCYEIFTGTVPFHEFRDSSIPWKVVSDRATPTRPGVSGSASECGLDDITWKLMASCWAYRPSDRPGMASVLNTLQAQYPHCIPPSAPHRSTLGVNVFRGADTLCSDRVQQMTMSLFDRVLLETKEAEASSTKSDETVLRKNAADVNEIETIHHDENTTGTNEDDEATRHGTKYMELTEDRQTTYEARENDSAMVLVRIRNSGEHKIIMKLFDAELRKMCPDIVLSDSSTVIKKFRIDDPVNFVLQRGRRIINYSRIFNKEDNIDVNQIFNYS